MGLDRKGRSWAALKEQLAEFKKLDYSWQEGRLPSFTYMYREDVLKVQQEAYLMFMQENALGTGKAFHSLQRMLEDIYAAAFQLFHAPATAGASFTSGGTESVFQAIKVAKKLARERGQPEPFNIVGPTSAHPAMDKAAQILDLQVRRTGLGAGYRANAQAMAEACDSGTILLWASAPGFPYAVFDPIEEIGRLALDRQVWLHVDACWGGFLSPFAAQLGYPIPPFDFRVPGVTSLSADLHKFGYGAKGASLIVYRDRDIQRLEKFSHTWVRGVYETPGFSGSRPGGAIAAAWAVMNYLGVDGYLEATRLTMETTERMARGVDAIDGLSVGSPLGEANLFFFTADDPAVDINAVAKEFGRHGWFVGGIREPLGIHQGVNPLHAPIVERYLDDLADSVRKVRGSGEKLEFDKGSY